MNKYQRTITGKGVTDVNKASCVVDVYDVLVAFSVTCPARAHAIKKILCAGQRGDKSAGQDLSEARDSLLRAIELESSGGQA